MGAPSRLEARRANGMDRKDKRVARTEKAIREAFFKLLGDVDYEKISVSALAREAGVDRKTFYLHYKSIDALADEILRVRALRQRQHPRKLAARRAEVAPLHGLPRRTAVQ